MGLPQKSLAYITPEEYLALEAVAKEKHEYLDGRIYAWQGYDANGMAGAPLVHNRICLNIAVALRQNKLGTDCEVMMSDIRVSPEGGNSYFYPDLLVRCGPALPGDITQIDDACAIIEVLSDSTQAFDRGEKFERYQKMPALQTYVLVSPVRKTIEVFSRADAWQRRNVEHTSSFSLCDRGMTLHPAVVFAGA